MVKCSVCEHDEFEIVKACKYHNHWQCTLCKKTTMKHVLWEPTLAGKDTIVGRFSVSGHSDPDMNTSRAEAIHREDGETYFDERLDDTAAE